MLKPFRAKRVGQFYTLNFQFAGATDISSQITFTRASTGSFFNSAGVLTNAAANAPRLDYNPSTLAAQGLLIEESRANQIRNNTMVGAVAGTPGTVPTNWFAFTGLTGLTQTIVGTGTDSGITYIDIRVNGTPSAAGAYSIGFESNTQVAALTGQTWVLSTYLKLQTGSFAGVNSTVLQNDERSASAYIRSNSSSALTVTGAALSTQRSFFAATLSGGGTVAFVVPYILLSLSGAAIDITLRIGLPQLELGAFATSVIPTTTTALTRAADVASVNTLSPWYNATEGTLYAEGTLLGGVAATFPYMAALVGAAPNNDSIGVLWTATAGLMRFGVRAGAVSQADFGAGTAKSANSSYKVAGRYAANDVQAAFDGTLGTQDTTATVPTIAALSLGGAVGFQPAANTWLRRITYYPRRLSNAELQTLTT